MGWPLPSACPTPPRTQGEGRLLWPGGGKGTCSGRWAWRGAEKRRKSSVAGGRAPPARGLRARVRQGEGRVHPPAGSPAARLEMPRVAARLGWGLPGQDQPLLPTPTRWHPPRDSVFPCLVAFDLAVARETKSCSLGSICILISNYQQCCSRPAVACRVPAAAPGLLAQGQGRGGGSAPPSCPVALVGTKGGPGVGAGVVPWLGCPLSPCSRQLETPSPCPPPRASRRAEGLAPMAPSRHGCLADQGCVRMHGGGPGAPTAAPGEHRIAVLSAAAADPSLPPTLAAPLANACTRPSSST